MVSGTEWERDFPPDGRNGTTTVSDEPANAALPLSIQADEKRKIRVRMIALAVGTFTNNTTLSEGEKGGYVERG